MVYIFDDVLPMGEILLAVNLIVEKYLPGLKEQTLPQYWTGK